MEQIKHLILKDLSFRFKLGLLCFLFTWLFIFGIATSGKALFTYVLMLVPGLLFSGFIMYNCYLEDNYSTLTFLKSLPVSKKMLIQEKFLLSNLFIVIGIIETFIFYLLLPAIPFPFQLSHIFLSTAVMEIYFGTFLYLFYRFNFFASRFPPNVFVMSLLFLHLKKIEFQSITIPLPLATVILIIALIVNYLLMIVSIKKMR